MYFMNYQVMECRYNYRADETDILFATNDRKEAIEAAKELGPMVVLVDQGAKCQLTYFQNLIPISCVTLTFPSLFHFQFPMVSTHSEARLKKTV